MTPGAPLMSRSFWAAPVMLKAMFICRLMAAAMVPPLQTKVPGPLKILLPYQTPAACSTVLPVWIALVPLMTMIPASTRVSPGPAKMAPPFTLV